MIKFKLFNNFNKKKLSLIALLILVLLFILGKNYISEVDPSNEKISPSTKIKFINIAKVVIPLKNIILMRNVDDKITLLKSSGSCVFCDLTKGNFKGSDLKGFDLRGANLSGVDLSNSNLSGAILRHINLSGANLSGVDLRNIDLTGVNLTGVDLSNKALNGTLLTYANFSGANLDGVDLRNKDLTGVNLSGVDLSNKDLTGTILSGVDLSNKDLTGTLLTYANFSGANLDGVDFSNKDLTGVNLSGVDLSGFDLRNKDLTGANLSGVDLSNQDLSGTILAYANLSEANLDGVDLRNKDLTGVNLSGVDLSNQDLSGTTLKDAKKIEISVKNPSNSSWPALIADQNLKVTRYDLTENMQYVATQEGFLFELKNNESRLVLDLKNDNRLQGTYADHGIFGVASQNKLVYVSYITQDNNGSKSLVVDEYSMNFSKVRNIIKIGGLNGHYGGNLSFDSLGRLYLSVGEGSSVGDGSMRGDFDNTHPQDLNSLRGKILRLDVSILKLEPEIVAYGIRRAWGVTIDSKDRMFILDCGNHNVEAVYLLNDLYSRIPANLGWPVFEGSTRIKKDPLMFNDVLAPIFEYNNRPGCVTAGVYLDDLESFLFADFYGTIGLLKQQENGKWHLLHEYKQEKNIWGFGLDEKTKKIFIAPNNLELEILVDQVNLNQ